MNNRSVYINIICATLLLFMSACHFSSFKQDSGQAVPEAGTLALAEQKVAETMPAEQPEVVKNGTAHSSQQQKILEIGSGKYIATPSVEKETVPERGEGDITLNFQSTNINEFIKVILSDILNENFIIDPQVSGMVTIETSQPVSKTELFPLLEDILAINNAAIVKSDGFYKILPRQKAIKGNLSPDVIDRTINPGYSVRIIPLNFIAAQEMQKILEPFVSEGGNMRIDKQRNIIILAGTPQELSTLQETIEIFDVDWLRGRSVGLYPLDYVDPESLKAELDVILGSTSDSSGNELLGGLIRTLPIKRLNSILLISSTATALREAEVWLHQLDRPGEKAGQHLYVYEVQNAKATELADILEHIFDVGTKTSSKTLNNRELSLAPGTTPIEITDSRDSSGDTATNVITDSPPVSVGSSEISLSSGAPIEIIADDTRNALVILADPEGYHMVAAALRKLDIVPLQVLIEASILEVKLEGDLDYGVEWFFNNRVGGRRTGQGTLDLGSAGLSALAPGFSYTIVNSASNIKVALNALETESEINLLSAPSLMVLDNQTATINVGDEIPIPIRQSISNVDSSAPTVNEIQFRKTGITLEVTPRVNNSGLVTMEIRQEVSDAIATTSSSIDAPTIQQRQIESTVAINTGETIVLGGLIRSSDTENEGGLPGLYKIPLIGRLFGNVSIEKRRTELIVLLTPRVVRNNNDARDITDEFRRKLRNLPPIPIQQEELNLGLKS